ncbi:glycosyltransferase [bacterium]|nr:glycosyltransferase [bacterium]
MNIVQITPGAGGMFCGGCFRDNALVTALRKLDHQVLMVPLYLPMTLDEPDQSEGTPTFYNGIQVYLDQKYKLFRKGPNWLHKLAGSPRLLKFLSKRAVKTQPAEVGDLTLSMLEGELGNQARELDDLIAFLRTQEEKPDVVVLSNALMMGMVRKIRLELDVPVVVTLQGEDWFVNSLPEQFRERCWQHLVHRAREVDLFVAPSQYYAAEMMRYLDVGADRMRIVHNGINLDGYMQAAVAPHPPSLGYFARMCEEKGLGLLVDTYIELKRRDRVPHFKLRIGGGCGPGDEPFVDDLKNKMRKAKCLKDVEFYPNLSRGDKLAFFRQLTVFCTPAMYGESFGLYLIEALAAGIPAVQPNVAAFPEIFETIGGGVLAEGNPEALADAIMPFLRDPNTAREYGERVRESTHNMFSIELMAERMVAVYEEAAESWRAARQAAETPPVEDTLPEQTANA